MVEYSKVKVTLTDTQLKKLKTAVKNNAGTTLRGSLKMLNGNNLPQKLVVVVWYGVIWAKFQISKNWSKTTLKFQVKNEFSFPCIPDIFDNLETIKKELCLFLFM